MLRLPMSTNPSPHHALEQPRLVLLDATDGKAQPKPLPIAEVAEILRAIHGLQGCVKETEAVLQVGRDRQKWCATVNQKFEQMFGTKGPKVERSGEMDDSPWDWADTILAMSPTPYVPTPKTHLSRLNTYFATLTEWSQRLCKEADPSGFKIQTPAEWTHAQDSLQLGLRVIGYVKNGLSNLLA